MNYQEFIEEMKQAMEQELGDSYHGSRQTYLKKP